MKQSYFLAVLAFVAWMTSAMVVINLVFTDGAIDAGVRLAFINVQLANETRKASSRTVALKATQLINAPSRVEARL